MIKELKSQEIQNILGIGRDGLKTIEHKGELEFRLKEKHILLLNKEKRGRNNYYLIDDEYIWSKEEREIYYKRMTVKDRLAQTIPYDLQSSIGIYKITLDNKIYIGSTIASFYDRYQAHSWGEKPSTKELLDNGGKFEIVQICDGMEEYEIRRIEANYIEEYINDPQWICVNEVSGWGEKKNYNKRKNIVIKEKDYEEAIKILQEHGIKVLPHKKIKK